MRAQVTWLEAGERRLIYEEALGILERRGMRFGPCRALDRLAAAGALVDREAGVARLPGELVERALALCPHEVLLAGATPDDDCLLDGSIHFAPSGTPTHTLDFETGAYRSSTVEDLRRSTIVCDAMDAVDIMWATVTGGDCPEGQRTLSDCVTMLRNTRKHVQHEIVRPEEVAPMVRVAEIVSGSLAEFRRRPRISIVCCTSSPLHVDGAFLDICIEAAACGMPVLVYPMPIAGANAPITVAGTVVMNVAEFLGAATAIQVVQPGTPLIMGAGAGLLDMKATTFSFGALEGGQMCAACAEVAHHELGVPVLAPGLATDAKYAGIQAGFEKAMKGLVIASAGADIITGGIGLLNGANTMSLPQIVIDAEIATMIRRVLGEVEVSHESAMAEAIERIGFDGTFLGEKETRRRVRAGEHFLPTIATRLSFEQWRERGGSESETAVARVRRLLDEADARGPLLDPAQDRELESVVAGMAARA